MLFYSIWISALSIVVTIASALHFGISSKILLYTKLIIYTLLVLNFYRYKTFVPSFQKIMESVEDVANSVFHEDLKFFKSVIFKGHNTSKVKMYMSRNH